MKFLCDEMLHGLARWLRAAGYDTEIAADARRDAALLARARAEERILLTRDRALAAAAGGAVPALLLGEAGLDDTARHLSAVLGVDWQHAPFSRCLVDNAPLAAAPAEDWQRVPQRSRAGGGDLRSCPACGRLYWTGGHVRRMRERLAGWSRRNGEGAPA